MSDSRAKSCYGTSRAYGEAPQRAESHVVRSGRHPLLYRVPSRTPPPDHNLGVVAHRRSWLTAVLTQAVRGTRQRMP